MKKKMKYFVVQKYEIGEWKNCSVTFILQGLRGALNCLGYLKRENSGEKYRIARGEKSLEI